MTFHRKALAAISTAAAAVAATTTSTTTPSNSNKKSLQKTSTYSYYVSSPSHKTKFHSNYCCECEQQQYQQNYDTLDEIEEDEESRNFHETLQYHRLHLNNYKQSWNWHNANSRIPTVSWPLNIPNESEVKALEVDLLYCKRRRSSSSSPRSSSGHSSNGSTRYCNNLQFRIASYLLLQQDPITQQKGYNILQNLAEKEKHPDAICAYATCLNNGRGGGGGGTSTATTFEPNPKAAVSWWKYASDTYDHIQSTYELGVAFYTGEGVAEDESIAILYFRKAAECGHAGAAYMLGDCLLDGVGVERDRGEALEWLVTAAELGHRGARSRVLAVLEKKDGEDYGCFTDASRQSLIVATDGATGANTDENDDGSDKETDTKKEKRKESSRKSDGDVHSDDTFTSGKQRDEREKPYSGTPGRSLERRFTIGGGARNPVVLARRKTIVTESRKLE